MSRELCESKEKKSKKPKNFVSVDGSREEYVKDERFAKEEQMKVES